MKTNWTISTLDKAPAMTGTFHDVFGTYQEAVADAEAEQVAWEWFSGAHPHEAHAKWPDRFWRFFQSRCPGVTREQMERTLSETDESPNDKVSDGGPRTPDFK